jgi:hypothetical protein
MAVRATFGVSTIFVPAEVIANFTNGVWQYSRASGGTWRDSGEHVEQGKDAFLLKVL